MSHLVTIQTKLRDPVAVTLACRRLGLAEPTMGRAELFAEKVSGLVVRLPQWRYPAVVDLASGDLRYDNYNGVWGDSIQIDRLVQAYAVEKTKLEVRKKGWSVQESILDNGSVQLQITQSA